MSFLDSSAARAQYERMFRHALLIAAALIGTCAVTDATFATDVLTLLSESANLSAEEVKALEAQLESDPLDMSTRTRLLGYFGDLSRYDEAPSRVRLRELGLWLIRNEPKSLLLGALDPHIRELDPYWDPVAYKEGKQAYLKHL